MINLVSDKLFEILRLSIFENNLVGSEITMLLCFLPLTEIWLDISVAVIHREFIGFFDNCFFFSLYLMSTYLLKVFET